LSVLPDTVTVMPAQPTSVRHAYSSLWRVRSYVRPHAAQIVLMVLGAGGAVGASIVIPLIAQRVIDGPVADGDTSGLVALGLLALAFGAAEALLVFLRMWTQSYAALGIETTIRGDLYQKLQRLPVAFHDRWQTGQLLSRATIDLSTIRRFLSFGMVFFGVYVVTFVVVVVLLLRIYWPLALVVAAMAVPLFFISVRLEREYIVISRRVQDEQGDLATYVEESAAGIRTVKAFGRRRHVNDLFAGRATTLHDSAVVQARLIAKFWGFYDLVPNVTLALVLVGGALAVARGDLQIGELVAFVALVLVLVWPITELGFILAMAQEAMTAADRVYEVLDSEATVADRPHARELERVRGRLRLDRVAFRYPDADEPVLRDITLDVAPGETVALVGTTGSGKTTLTALVPRLYDVTGGRITIDGNDVRDVRLSSLRRVVATAFEDPTLFSASVRENLTLGRPEASDAEVDEAIDIAQAGFVRDLPWGLDTRIGEQGLTLSGGQRQRLALARAVIGRPAVLVLDDPLSALDVHTEALVEEALARVLALTTALLVVHRPSTVALADRVALLEDGVISAVGTHRELLATVPAYRAVLSQQAEAHAAEDDGPVEDAAEWDVRTGARA
jgi:ATP-binding cassette subfamily B protein